MTVKIVSYLLIITLTISCKGQLVDMCKENSNKGQEYFNQYVVTMDTINIRKSIYYYSKSKDCKETKINAISKIITNYLIIEDYKRAYQFIDSTQIVDYQKEYSKEVYFNIFRGMYEEVEGNYKSRNEHYRRAVDRINKTISKSQASSSINIEDYGSLYYVKSLFENKDSLEKEIRLLENKYPEHKEYLEGLIYSILSKEDQVSEPMYD